MRDSCLEPIDTPTFQSIFVTQSIAMHNSMKKIPKLQTFKPVYYHWLEGQISTFFSALIRT